MERGSRFRFKGVDLEWGSAGLLGDGVGFDSEFGLHRAHVWGSKIFL